MFCPKCGYEYREGFVVCRDCRVPLVKERPGLDARPEYAEFTQVLFTYNPADIAFIKSLLDSEGIRYYFLGEHFSYVRPLAEPARLMVEKDFVEDAVELLRNASLSITIG